MPPLIGSPHGLQGGLVGGANIYNADNPALKLGIAGTCYFVPEAERYAFMHGPTVAP